MYTYEVDFCDMPQYTPIHAERKFSFYGAFLSFYFKPIYIGVSMDLTTMEAFFLHIVLWVVRFFLHNTHSAVATAAAALLFSQFIHKKNVRTNHNKCKNKFNSRSSSSSISGSQQQTSVMMLSID